MGQINKENEEFSMIIDSITDISNQNSQEAKNVAKGVASQLDSIKGISIASHHLAELANELHAETDKFDI